MPETDDIDLEKVDMELEEERPTDEGPEIVVLTERAPMPSVHDFFAGMIEEILDAKVDGLISTHDHVTDTNSPEPWLEELLVSFVKEDEVWMTVAKVLDSNEELRDFVVSETRKVLRANLGTIGEAVKGALDDLKVFVTLNEHGEALAQLQQLVDNKIAVPQNKALTPKDIDLVITREYELDYSDADGYTKYGIINARNAMRRSLKHGAMLDGLVSRVAELENEVSVLKAEKTKSKES